MGFIEALTRIGIGIGPVIGSVLYKYFGFIHLFLIYGLTHIIYIPLMILVSPDNIDSDSTDTKSLVKDKDQESSTQVNSDISLFKILSNPLTIIC